MQWFFFPKKMKYTKEEVAARVADRLSRGTIVIDLIDDLDDGLDLDRDRVSPSQTREHKRGGNKLERHGAEASGTFTFVTIDDDRAIGTNHNLKKPRPSAPSTSAPEQEQEPWADCDPGALPDIGELIATPIPQWVPVVSPDPGTTPAKLVSPAEWDQWLVRT